MCDFIAAGVFAVRANEKGLGHMTDATRTEGIALSHLERAHAAIEILVNRLVCLRGTSDDAGAHSALDAAVEEAHERGAYSYLARMCETLVRLRVQKQATRWHRLKNKIDDELLPNLRRWKQAYKSSKGSLVAENKRIRESLAAEKARADVILDALVKMESERNDMKRERDEARAMLTKGTGCADEDCECE